MWPGVLRSHCVLRKQQDSQMTAEPDKLNHTSPPLPVKIHLKIKNKKEKKTKKRDEIRREEKKQKQSDLSVCNLFTRSFKTPFSPLKTLENKVFHLIS